ATRKYPESSHPPAGVKPRWMAYHESIPFVTRWFSDGPADIRHARRRHMPARATRRSRAADGQDLQDWIACSGERTDTWWPDRHGRSSCGFARSGLGRRKELLNRNPLGGCESAAPARTRLKALPVALILALGTTTI